MFGISFNHRTEMKLNELVGIRSRLALLALYPRTPLILERARSLSKTAPRQPIALRTLNSESRSIARTPALRYFSLFHRSETVLKSAPHITLGEA